jgi:23S rRNA (cytosine1962-C5)-methyltransferase
MQLNYELLDSGNQQKWERFGDNTVIRPEVRAVWQPRLAQWSANAHCKYQEKGVYVWQKDISWKEPWLIKMDSLCFELHLSQSKNIGIFPEQIKNWRWLSHVIKNSSKPNPKVLNLFAYTGGATLVAAKAGARVCHVDASKSTMHWASQNALLSLLNNQSIRWIADDAVQFLKREIKRGVVYDGIILDPPPVGHGTKGAFVFKNNVEQLLILCKQVLRHKPLFFLFNCYAMNYSHDMAKKLVVSVFKEEKFKSAELFIQEKNRRKQISCSVYVRSQLDL